MLTSIPGHSREKGPRSKRILGLHIDLRGTLLLPPSSMPHLGDKISLLKSHQTREKHQ